MTKVFTEPQFISMGIFCPKCHTPAHWTQLDEHHYIMNKICSNCGAEMPKIEKIKLLTKIDYLNCKKCHGNRHRLIRYAHGGFRISCPLCGYCTNIKETEDDAIIAWNTR